jgi:hypothetical protein
MGVRGAPSAICHLPYCHTSILPLTSSIATLSSACDSKNALKEDSFAGFAGFVIRLVMCVILSGATALLLWVEAAVPILCYMLYAICNMLLRMNGRFPTSWERSGTSSKFEGNRHNTDSVQIQHEKQRRSSGDRKPVLFLGSPCRSHMGEKGL